MEFDKTQNVGPLTYEIIERADEASCRVAKAFPISEMKGLTIEECLEKTTPIYVQACRERLEREGKS